MTALTYMCLSVIIWSLYPLAATIGLKTMGSFEMILVVYYFSGAGAILLAFFYLWQSKLLKQSIEIQKTLHKTAYIPIIVSGVSGVLCHSFFIIALTLAHKGGVSLLYESWPIIAVVATPFLMKKRWKEVSFKEFLVSIIALVGVAIIILSDEGIGLTMAKTHSLSDSVDYTALGGYILAFAGAYMCAILVVTKGTYSENFKTLKDDFAASIISEVFSRLISMVLMLIAFVFLHQKLDFGSIHWASTFFIGFVVFVVGGALYTISLLKADRPTIQIIYYFVPVLAVVWLWLAGESSVNAGLFIGGAIILISNLYLDFASRKAKFSRPL